MDKRFSYGRPWPVMLILLCLWALLTGSLTLGHWPDYGQWLDTLDEPLSRLRWIIGDISEVAFYKHELPALGLLLWCLYLAAAGVCRSWGLC